VGWKVGPGLEVPVGPNRFVCCWERWSLWLGGSGVVWQEGVCGHGVGLGCFHWPKQSTC